MRRLHLLRHGDAESHPRGEKDHDRALSARGQQAVERIGAHLQNRSAVPELILCSSARRAIETLAAIRPFLGARVTEYIERALYLVSADALLERVLAVGNDPAAILLVGHNPGIGRLAHELSRPVDTPDFERLSRSFPTAALVTLRFDFNSWYEVGAGRAHLEEFTISESFSDNR